MKIAIIGQKGIPAKIGGVEKHVEGISLELAKMGHEVYVYTRPSYTDKNLAKYKNVNLISIPSINTKHLDAISHTFLACLDIIFNRKFDIVHFHSIGPSALIFMIKIFRPKLPIVATFHCQDYYHQKWNKFARGCLRIGERIACKSPDKVITVSEILKAYTNSRYNVEAEYIPNGAVLQTQEEAQEIKNIWNLEKDSYFLTTSRLIRHKGIHYAIQAYNNLKTDKKLVIAGNGFFTDDYARSLKELAHKNKNIIFTGVQSGKILAELYSNAYLLLQPSESEGLSLSLLEAMSYGTPILASDIPENKEALGGAGFTFKNKDTDDLEKKMRELLDFNLAKSKTEKEISRIRDIYNWPKIVKDIVLVY
ncbi:MAG: glycosyltransferase family 4 protein, partial [Clostridiales bacterium]|nr:glycosyltransferase family 4 protein [Clostridiales bacterium]